MASVLSELAVAAEAATEDFANACDAVAVAEAAYMRAYYSALARSEETTNAGRERSAEAAAVEEKIALRFAEQAEKRCKAKVTTLLARLSAAQSWARMTERQS